MSKSPIRVVVTGAAGQISYSLLALIAKESVDEYRVSYIEKFKD